MKKLVVILVLIFVLCLSFIGAVSAGNLRNWKAAYTYDLPAGTLRSPDWVPYNFNFSWTYPEPGGTYPGPGGSFSVSEDAELYPGYVVFRGDYVAELTGVWAKPQGVHGRKCLRLPEPVTIHPDQSVRFHMGWQTDYPMTANEAKAHFQSMIATVDLGDGPIEMVGHEITPSENGNYWTNNICSYTVRN